MSEGRILVVDDEPQIHRFLKPALIAAGYEPLQALTPAFVLGVAPELGRGAAPVDMPSPPATPSASETVEQVLARFGGRRDEAAAYLGISRTTLWRKLRK